MERNVCGVERGLRIVVGIALLGLGGAALGGLLTLAGGTTGLVLAGGAALVGAILLTTGAVRICPINAALGIDTCAERAEEREVGIEG
ncbi:DUF2892 domain-containing protein [Halobacteria archaeon AArc-dxtr1]|nr:DUF2892 domain-containing protein [Halobacteria archaeon AArc-dxtr1]